MFAYVVVFLVAFLVVGCLHLVRTNPRELVPGAWATSTPVLLAKAAVCACARPQGVLSEEWKVEPEAEGRRSATGNVKIPDDKLEALSTTEEKWRIDPDAYAKYCRICGYDVKHDQEQPPQKPTEPYCFLETPFLRHLFLLIVSPAFPLSPLALIHIRQTVTAYVTMRSVLTTTCDMRCGVTEMRVTTKGVEIDFQFSIYSQEGELLADGVSTVLSRNQSTRLQFKQRSSVESKPFSGEKADFSVKTLAVPADTGVRYSSASGDYQPHHLYPWTARLVGYNQPMAHGMWTLSRAVATIQEAHGQSLSVPLRISGSFKRPLYLPSEAAVFYTAPDDSKMVCFEVRDKSHQSLHLQGNIICL